MKLVDCLSCGTHIDVGDRPRLFQEIYCPSCKQKFTIIEIYPLEICYPLMQELSDQESGFPPTEEEN